MWGRHFTGITGTAFLSHDIPVFAVFIIDNELTSDLRNPLSWLDV
jgi:hypothetical protein